MGKGSFSSHGGSRTLWWVDLRKAESFIGFNDWSLSQTWVKGMSFMTLWKCAHWLLARDQQMFIEWIKEQASPLVALLTVSWVETMRQWCSVYTGGKSVFMSQHHNRECREPKGWCLKWKLLQASSWSAESELNLHLNNPSTHKPAQRPLQGKCRTVGIHDLS